MSYIGTPPSNAFTSLLKQDFSTSATTGYTLDHAVNNANDIALFINFVRQEPTAGYAASGTSLVLTSATASSDDMYCVYLGQALQTVNPPNASVGSSQVAASIITGQTALASEPADTDEFLVSDAGTLKRIDYSLIKGGGITEADIFSLTSSLSLSAATQTIVAGMARATYTKVGRIGTGISHSSGVFSFTNTGIYKIIFKARFQKNGSTRFVGADILVTTDNSTYNQATGGAGNIYNFGSTGYMDSMTEIILDVTDTSNVKIKPNVYSDSTATVAGNGGGNSALTSISFIRLGDT